MSAFLKNLPHTNPCVRCFKHIWKVGKVGRVGKVGTVGKVGMVGKVSREGLIMPT
jgi:hypothetical protein